MVNAAFAGRSYPPTPVYEVGREKIREFAEATGAAPGQPRPRGRPRPRATRDVVAPPTFA